MNPFQWIALPLLGAVLLAEAVALARGRSARLAGLVRSLVWAAAALAIARPDWTSDAAALVGIHRGTDLVLYLFVLAFIGAAFYFYARGVRLQRELTELVRHVAIREARRGRNPES